MPLPPPLGCADVGLGGSPAAGFCQIGPLYSVQLSEENTESLGFFGNVTWQVTDQLELAAGARYIEDEKEFKTAFWNGDPASGLPGNLSVTFEGVSAVALIQGLRTIAVSTGSGCSSANPEPSHVLLAIGATEEQADATLRFGLGRGNTAGEIDETIEALVREVGRLRALHPVS